MGSTYIFLLFTTNLLWFKHLQTAPTPEHEDIVLSTEINVLSKLGKEYVVQELIKTFTGIRNMMKIMEENEKKHKNILKSVRKTMEEREEAIGLFSDINQRLKTKEIQCEKLLGNTWESCKICLEHSCLRFYTASCSKQVFHPFLLKIKDSFKIWSPLTFQHEDENNVSNYKKGEFQLLQAKNIFSQLISDVSTLINQSLVSLRSVQQELDQSFEWFNMSTINKTNCNTQAVVPSNDPVKMISLNHCDWLGLFLYFYDFGNAVYQAIINAAYKIFKYIHKEGNVFFSPLEGSEHYFKDSNLMYSTTVCAELQNSSQCLRYQGKCQLCYEAFLKDCPDVLELHVKSEEAVRLVGLAGKQFQDLGNIVHQHANNTSLIINQLKERYGWMAKHSNMLSVTDIFSIKKVTFSPSNDYATANETLVELSIMKSPNFVVLIPGNLDLHNPSLIQYLSERALQYYKNNFNE